MQSKILGKVRLPVKLLDELQGNFKTLGKKQFEKLKRSIEKNGFIQPFFIWRKDERTFILDGHQRKKAIIDLYGDLIDVDCLEIKAENFQEAKKFCIYYASSYAEFSKDSLLEFGGELAFEDLEDFNFPGVTFSEDDFLNIGSIEGEDDIPDVAENECGVELGDVWQLGEHRLMCGDSTELESINKLLEGKKIELCFTSPPYSDMREYNGNKDLSPEKISKFMLANCDLFVVNLGLQRKNGEIFPYWDAYINRAKEFGYKLISWNVWDKLESGSIGNQTAMFPIEHEWIFIFGKQSQQINKTIPTKWHNEKHSGQTTRKKDGSLEPKKKSVAVSDTKKLGTVYRGSPEKARNFDFDHPAMFPVHFPESYILSCTKKSDLVYEPFGGSGTTLIACEKTLRKCCMMEIDPHYCSVIIKRWEKYSGKKAVKCQTNNP